MSLRYSVSYYSTILFAAMCFLMVYGLVHCAGCLFTQSLCYWACSNRVDWLWLILYCQLDASSNMFCIGAMILQLTCVMTCSVFSLLTVNRASVVSLGWVLAFHDCMVMFQAHLYSFLIYFEWLQIAEQSYSWFTALCMIIEGNAISAYTSHR